MATTYTFLTDDTMKLEIAPTLNGLEKVVTRVRYIYEGINEDGIKGTFAGVTPMPEPTDIEGYKPFVELTPEDIVSWLEAVSDKNHMQERIEKQIIDQIVPKNIEVSTPWATQISETPIFNQTSTTTQTE